MTESTYFLENLSDDKRVHNFRGSRHFDKTHLNWFNMKMDIMSWQNNILSKVCDRVDDEYGETP